MAHDVISGPGIQAAVITPTAGTQVLEHNEILRLVVEASDIDRLIQACGCKARGERSCSTGEMLPVTDPVGWAWQLVGPGRLLAAQGPSNLYEPPEIPVGDRVELEIIVTTGDSRGNDNVVRIHFKVTIERPQRCEYRRTIRITVEDDPFPDRSITQSPCDCEPDPPSWLPEPTPIDGFLVGPRIVSTGERYLLDAGGSDSDQLTLGCSGRCGEAMGGVSLPDELVHTWSARLGSFPDHPAPVTSGWQSSVIYKAPDKPGLEHIEVLIRDSGAQAVDAEVRKKVDFAVVAVDLDIDSDNTRESDEEGAQEDPERTETEDRIEDDACRPGKVLPVNDADRDADCPRDFVDGFNAAGQEGPDKSRRFTPAILEIPEPVDLTKARVRFVYSASNPGPATTSTTAARSGFAPAPGHLRLWAKDGHESRLKETLDQGGDFAAPGIWYRPPSDFRNGAGARTWRFFVEGIEPSDEPGDQRILAELDPDGSGAVCRDAVRATVVRVQNVPADSVDVAAVFTDLGAPPPPEKDELPLFLTRSRPTIELSPLGTSSMQLVNDSTLRLRLAGSVRDRIADIAANRAADIARVTIGEIALAVVRDPAEPPTRARPFAFRGRFAGEVDLRLATGKNRFPIRTSANAIELAGELVLTIEAARVGSGSDALRVTRVTIGASAPGGCFHAYFARVRDARGVAPAIDLDANAFAMESPGADVSLTRRPYVVVDLPPRVADPSIIRLRPGDPLEWKYFTMHGLWPVTKVDVIGDIDADGQITGADEPAKALAPGLKVELNGNDDDGDGRPDNADEAVNGAADRAQMATVILRRPLRLADEARVSAVLREAPSEGAVRVFLPRGTSQAETLVGPGRSESRDLWDELKHGDITVLVEGVRKGDDVLSLELGPCEARCSDAIALRVLGFELALGADEPFLDADSSAVDAELAVPADHVAVDYDGVESLGVNLYALFNREDELDGAALPPDRTVSWEVEPLPNAGCNDPTLRDMLSPANPQRRIDRAPVVNGVSRVQLDYTFTHPNGRWVKSGDAFRVRVRAQAPDGETLEREMRVSIVAGSKRFHVTNPPPGFDPLSLWRLSDAQFIAAYGGSHFEPPIASGATAPISLCLLDQFRNVLEPGTPVTWKMEGSGLLGRFDPDPSRRVDPNENPDTSQQIEAAVGAGGLAAIQFTQTRYPSCPWQPNPEIHPAATLIGVDDTLEQANTSVVDRSAPLPPAVGPLVLTRTPFTVTPDFMRPDIARGDRRPVRMRLVRRTSGGDVPLAGVKVTFTSLNGRLEPPDGVAITDTSGEASVTLTSRDATPGEVVVVGAIGTTGIRASFDAMRWVTSDPVVVTPQHRVVAGDRTTDGMLFVETLQDKGERLDFPNAVEGDGLLGVPYWAGTSVSLQGQPNHLYVVVVTDDLTWRLAARYPFDSADAGKTEDVESGREADVRGALPDPAVKREGMASFRFDAGDTTELPGSPAVTLAGGLRLQLHVRPETVAPAVLLERAGEYRLEVRPAGTLAFTVRPGGPAAVTAESARPLLAGVWSSVELIAAPGALLLTVDTEGQPVDRQHAVLPAVSAVASGVPVIVGGSFRGHLDDVRFTKGGWAPPLLSTAGLVGSTIATNANGTAQFSLQSTGAWDPNRYAPVRARIIVAGSPGGEAQVLVAPSTLWADFVAAGKAFLTGSEGLGENAGWFQKAAAWASESLPLVSDLRTLAFELYKGATGCDSVSLLNVSFAMLGIVTDVASFGTAGQAVRASRQAFCLAAKSLLKRVATGVIHSAVMDQAFAGFMELATKEIARADGTKERAPADWVLTSQAYLESLTQWMSQGVAPTIEAAFRSVDDVFLWSQVYAKAGDVRTLQVMNEIEAVGREVEGPHP